MSTVVAYLFLSLYVNVGIMYLLNFFCEWRELCMFISIKALFCCGNCNVKANDKMGSNLYTNSVVNSS